METHLTNIYGINGEGAGSTDDNIYLRVDANSKIILWLGLDSGAVNELYFGDIKHFCLVWSCYIGSQWS